MTGPLGLVGGDEFHPGNEPHDELLCAAAGPGRAYVVPTAAARGRPEAAVATAVAWFARFGLVVEELPVLRRGDAGSAALAGQAASAGFLYIAGGDPGLVASVLVGSQVGAAMIGAWRGGAVLAGSSAGAMVLCAHVLVRQTWPGHVRRRPIPGLGVVGGCAVLPHFDTFGASWVTSAQETLPPGTRLLGIDERSCALWRDGAWSALGAGAVTVIDAGTARRFPAGESVEGLPQPAIASTAAG